MRELVLQILTFFSKPLCPLENDVALRGESSKPLPPSPHDWNSKLDFELVNARRKCWLRNVTGGCRSCKMTFLRKGQEVLYLSNQHWVLLETIDSVSHVPL